MPAILTSPKAASGDVGGEARFSVTAVGNSSPGYQWLFDGNLIADATGPSLTLSNLQFSNVGLYSVRVSDGSNSKTSGAVHLGMRPRILAQPQSQSARPGDTVAFSVTAEGIGPLSYRWRRNNRFIGGQTNSTWVLTNVQYTDAATNYSVVVTHELPWGRYGIASSKASLAVEGSPTIEYTPGSQELSWPANIPALPASAGAAAPRLTSIQSTPGKQVILTITVPAGQPVVVEFKVTLSAGAWTTLASYSAAPTNRSIQLVTPAAGASGFYRLRLP
jgi:hypothetical protein